MDILQLDQTPDEIIQSKTTYARKIYQFMKETLQKGNTDTEVPDPTELTQLCDRCLEDQSRVITAAIIIGMKIFNGRTKPRWRWSKSTMEDVVVGLGSLVVAVGGNFRDLKPQVRRLTRITDMQSQRR